MKKILLVICLFSLVLPYTTYAQWTNDPAVNTEVNTWSDNTSQTMLTTDGDGGVFIVWTNDSEDIYAQRLDRNGYIRWSSHGEKICDANRIQRNPQIVSDDSGGAIIVWQDYRNGSNNDIYANRIDSAGTLLWANEDGIPICTAQDNQHSPLLVRDGSGGAIIAWSDTRESGNYIFAQRISRAGVLLWDADGIAVSDIPGSYDFTTVADGSDGAIFVWPDYRSNGVSDIYAQRLNLNGERIWVSPADSNGVLVCGASSFQQEPSVIATGNGGAIVVWQDGRTDDYGDLYSQRIDSNGNMLWQENGIPVCTLSSAQGLVSMASDGFSGAYVAWNNYDGYYYNQYDLFAQHISSDGSLLWATGADTNGISVAADITDEISPQLMSDGLGGVYVVWSDSRLGNFDIYGQMFDSNGVRLWHSLNDSTGIPISSAPKNQSSPKLEHDAGDGLIVIWQDDREWSRPDIFAQQINRNGWLGTIVTDVRLQLHESHVFSLKQNHPNPFTTTTTISWHQPEKAHIVLKVYDFTGKKIKTLMDCEQAKGEHKIKLDASGLPAGIYFYQLQANDKIETKKMICHR